MTARPYIEAKGDLSGRARKSPEQPWTLDYLLERSMPEPNSGCWLWMGAMSWGYGVVNIGRRTMRTHRLAKTLALGRPIPSNLDVCHRCDTRLCVNPDHLFIGTRTDNMRDCANKGRIRVPGLAGDDCPNSKLNSAQVLAIRADPRSNRAVARHYGVNRGTISCIRRRLTWRTV